MIEPSSQYNYTLLAKFGHKLLAKQNRKKLILSLGILFCLLFFIKHHFFKSSYTKPAIAVTVNDVQQMNIPIYISALGNVISTYTITVKTQINGLLMKVLYKEGQIVKKGDLLAEIDDRLLQAQLIEYQGQFVRDQALLANALVDLKRYQRLWKQDSISQQSLATQESLVKQYQGAIEIDKGLIQSTKVNLNYCHIISPIDGRVGLRLVDPGNYVQVADTTGIVVITSLNPITVIFSVPEDDIPQITPQVFSKSDIEVQAFDRQQNKLLDTGILLTMDNQIDPATGTVKLRARFENKQNTLYPNQFVNIKLLVNNLQNAIVVSTAAIQHSITGDFVYVLKPNLTVTAKTVKVGITYGDYTVIEEGVNVMQRVVVDGADKLVEGAKVTLVKTEKA